MSAVLRAPSPLRRSSTVCAIVPHFGCEAWLGDALESLLDQTRPPDAIVVVDDGSPEPPVEVVRRYRGVTLLAAPDNGGPYRLVQAVIDRVDADAFLFQDADDWSAPDRLEVLLDEAERTGAELVGSHEVRVLVDDGHVVPVRYPLDVNAALAEQPTAFALLHPTSMIARSLMKRLGGFATGMRFSGDEEILRRAAHVARVVNADHFGYFRRRRAGSLTTATDTALRSRQRLEVQAFITDRARRNAEAVARGDAPDLQPWRVAAAPTLRHLLGPAPGRENPPSGRSPAPARRPPRRAPIFVVGAPRSGQVQLGWALGQHPALALLTDASWLATVAGDVGRLAREDAAVPPEFRAAMATTLLDIAAPHRHRPVAAGATLIPVLGALVTLWPDARFVHVVRHPDEVAASLAASPVDDGTFHTPDVAYSRWLEALDACLTLERALGPDLVLRISHARMLDDPTAVMNDVLAFVDAQPDDSSRRTLSGLCRPAASAAVPDAAEWLVARARDHWRELAPPSSGAARERALDELLGRFGGAPRSAEPADELTDKFRWLVAAAAPPAAVVSVISRGDPALIELDGRVGRHFPCGDDGGYTGYHPADSSVVLAQLEEQCRRGATHLALPATAFWWLDFYEGLRDHLDRNCRVVSYVESTGAVWALSGPAGEGSRRIPSLETIGAAR